MKLYKYRIILESLLFAVVFIFIESIVKNNFNMLNSIRNFFLIFFIILGVKYISSVCFSKKK